MYFPYFFYRGNLFFSFSLSENRRNYQQKRYKIRKSKINM